MARGFDVVVVGGGLVGLFAAWNLVRAGKTVLVVERDRVAGGTTGTSFAWLNATSKTEPAYHRLNAEGLARHRDLAKAWGEVTVGLHGAGAITWADPDAAFTPEDLAGEAIALKDLDYPCLWLDRDELEALEPHIVFGGAAQGMLAPRDRGLDAPVLARHLAHEIVGAGSEVREGTPVTAIGTGKVTAGGETVACGAVVIAAGPGTGEVVALAQEAQAAPIPVNRVPGLLVTLPTDPRRTWVNHVVYAPDAGNFHIRPTPDGGLLLGDDEIDRLIAERSDPSTVTQATSALLAVAQRHLPGLAEHPGLDAARAAIGVRPVPADGRTIAGPLPGAPGVFVLATHSGITLAPLLGELIAAEIVHGTISPLLGDFRPERYGETGTQNGG